MIAVVGLGAMGLGIAQVYALAGMVVCATDVSADARASALARMASALQPRVDKGAMTAEAMAETLSRVTIVNRLEDLQGALVIEAVAERLDIKTSLFAALEPILPEAVLATNTSSLQVGALARGLVRSGQVLGLHFFNPAPVMKLVELVPHGTTRPEALALARSLTEAAGKVVIQAPDRPGFIVNRCARPFYGEALALVEEGRDPAEIDAAMVAVGYRLGPFALIDLIGADINLAATEGLSAAMEGHPRYHVFDALRAQVASGALGRKAGRGFVDAVAPAPADASDIALRIEATLANEALWLAQEGIPAADIDRAMMLGLNFPRGPFAAMAAHGAERVRATLAALEARTALRGRYVMPS